MFVIKRIWTTCLHKVSCTGSWISGSIV